MKIGLLGCGNIARIIAARIGPEISIVAVYDRLPERALQLAGLTGARQCSSFQELLDEDFGVVVEAASVDAARDHAEKVLEADRDLVILSVGALAAPAFCESIRAAARQQRRKVYVPSGAIFGLDNVKVARVSPPEMLRLRTSKPPRSLGLDITERRQLFCGNHREAIRRFPKNINVSSALALAAQCEIEVELWADPGVEQNIHEIFFSGEFGQTEIRVANRPSPDNPATSYLAALSVLSLLKDLDDPIVVGT